MSFKLVIFYILIYKASGRTHRSLFVGGLCREHWLTSIFVTSSFVTEMPSQ